MTALLAVEWRRVLLPEAPGDVLEIAVRGTVIYLSLLLLFRFAFRRGTGSLGTSDLLVVVLVADAAQNGMAADYRSVGEGVVLVATIVFWAYIVDLASWRFPLLERLLRPPPLVLVRNGRMHRRNMRTEMVTEQELLTQVRENGCHDLSEVALALMESDGRISVVRREGA